LVVAPGYKVRANYWDGVTMALFNVLLTRSRWCSSWCPGCGWRSSPTTRPTTKPWAWHDAWIVAGFIVVVLLTANAAAHLNRRFLNVRTARCPASSRPWPPTRCCTIRAGRPWATVPAFLYLMVGHPDLGGAIGSSCGWVVIGLVAAKLLTRLSRRAPEPAAS
jgi:hypothetical protein